jgi:hypothetical protein
MCVNIYIYKTFSERENSTNLNIIHYVHVSNQGQAISITLIAFWKYSKSINLENSKWTRESIQH